MKYALPLLLLSLSPIAAQAEDRACHTIDEQQVAALFDRWNDDVQSGDPQRVVDNYAPGSLLLPTVSNTPRPTAAGKLDYFRHFLALQPTGEVVSRMIQIDCNSALDTGLYDFHLGDGSTVRARYTFTYKWHDPAGQWLITSHHSSALPQPAERVHEDGEASPN
ncbi:calcium/calmodulin dependent protein kinase II association-domain-containing protein [Pseudomonas sp. BAY1663]|uniref:Protein kinase n=1 Tax=Stutzerimonas stutzeri TaxID=316 RepID=A0A2N8T3T6_STUST|nr:MULTISPECIES: SgcJ/EcaC family oxidoreductase [Pseudomonadaceae]EXF46288.1 calcium/calmodulin dependent protein kinase II association-domain-containing protein [Pseudomonas sp. BAY1663]MCQ4323837.1 SgcJ/EcaC family oxidoreductase [Stutzerimonas stutzeri]PNG09414.1 protein kinase [Stutzerimonas stutzeri]